jgi:hypothetical protein
MCPTSVCFPRPLFWKSGQVSGLPGGPKGRIFPPAGSFASPSDAARREPPSSSVVAVERAIRRFWWKKLQDCLQSSEKREMEGSDTWPEKWASVSNGWGRSSTFPEVAFSRSIRLRDRSFTDTYFPRRAIRRD